MSRAVVLVNGWAMPDHFWSPLMASLGADRCYLLAVNNRADNLQAAARDLLSKAPHKALWLGWSLGGRLAVEAAALAPERVSALITLGASPTFVAAQGEPGLPLSTLQAFQHGMRDEPEATLKRFAALVAMGSSHKRTVLTAIREHQREVISQADAYANSLGWLAENRLESWRKVAASTPAVHVLGEHDALVPAHRAANGPGHWLVWEHCGHLLHWPSPEAVANLVHQVESRK